MERRPIRVDVLHGKKYEHDDSSLPELRR